MTAKEFNQMVKEQRSEHEEQVEVCQHLDSKGILYYAVPNGGKRYKKTASDLKKEGAKAGVPDLCICEPKGGFGGLYIEMKRRAKTLKNGNKSKAGITISTEQMKMIVMLNRKGYFACVCFGADEAIEIIDLYMSEKLR